MHAQRVKNFGRSVFKFEMDKVELLPLKEDEALKGNGGGGSSSVHTPVTTGQHIVSKVTGMWHLLGSLWHPVVAHLILSAGDFSLFMEF